MILSFLPCIDVSVTKDWDWSLVLSSDILLAGVDELVSAGRSALTALNRNTRGPLPSPALTPLITRRPSRPPPPPVDRGSFAGPAPGALESVISQRSYWPISVKSRQYLHVVQQQLSLSIGAINATDIVGRRTFSPDIPLGLGECPTH